MFPDSLQERTNIPPTAPRQRAFALCDVVNVIKPGRVREGENERADSLTK